MNDILLLFGIAYLVLCLWLGWYMWTMPDKDQREVGRAVRNSPTGQAFAELNEALRDLWHTILDALTTKSK